MKVTRLRVLLVACLGAFGLAVLDEQYTYFWRMQLFGERLLPETSIAACRKTYVYRYADEIFRYAEDVTQSDDWLPVFYHGDQETARAGAAACLYLDKYERKKRQEVRYDI